MTLPKDNKMTDRQKKMQKRIKDTENDKLTKIQKRDIERISKLDSVQQKERKIKHVQVHMLESRKKFTTKRIFVCKRSLNNASIDDEGD